MNLLIVAIGKMKASAELELCDTYRKRLGWKVAIKEIEAKGALPPAQQQEKESQLLLDAAKGAAVKILLDSRGKALSSEAFAKKLQGYEGRGQVALLIGGAYGFTETALKSADLLLSLGEMTWPHKLVRAMLCEQLYRASCILKGHPYHHA